MPPVSNKKKNNKRKRSHKRLFLQTNKMKNPLHILTTFSILIFGHGFTSAQNITANFSSTSVCFNNPTCFSDLSTSTFPITSWDWYFGDSSPHIFIKNPPCHTYASPGNYTVTLIVTNSNGDKDTVDHIATVNPLPIASFASTTVCAGNPTCFTDLSTILSGLITAWSWNFGDPPSGINNISNLQNPCHTYSVSGQFNATMTITSDSGCQATVVNSVTVNACTGVPDITEHKIINVYPNPFFSQTTLLTCTPFKEATLTVYNSFGEMVKQIDNLSGQTTIFHRDNLPRGLYFIRITQGNKTFATDKLVIAD